MRKLFIFLLLLGCCRLLKAQVTDFKLSDYKYRTDGYRALQVNGNFSGGGGIATKQKGGNNTSLDANASYVKTFSTDTRQQVITADAGLDLGYGNNYTVGSTSVSGADSSFFRFSPRLDFGNQVHVYKKDFFYQYGYAVNGEVDYVTHGQNNFRGLSAGVSGGIGRGRLENIGDAQTALFILNDLYAAKKIGKVDKEVANGLAKVITATKNKRVFDYRNRTEYELAQVDSFLHANHVLTQTDIRVFNIINDNLFFSFNNDLTGVPTFMNSNFDNDFSLNYYQQAVNNPVYNTALGETPDVLGLGYQPFGRPARSLAWDLFSQAQLILSGSSAQTPRFNGLTYYVTANFSNLASYSAGKSAFNQSGKPFYFSAMPEVQVGIEKHIAQDLKWQKILAANLFYRQLPDYFEKGTQFNKESFVYLYAKAGMGYYPNNRSAIEGTVRLSTSYVSMPPYHEHSLFLGPSGDLSGYYFLNATTMLQGVATLSISGGQLDTGGTGLSFQSMLQVRLLHYFY